MCCQRGYRETTVIPLGIGRETNKLKRRFEDALKKLRADLEVKLLQRDDLTEQQRMRKEGIPAQRGFSEPNDDDGMDVD